MANTIAAGLIPTVVRALDKVSRERVGLINAVNRDSSAEMVALDKTIDIPITPAVSAADNTPAVNAPDTGDVTIGTTTMSMTRSKHVAIRWNGEETMGLKGSGAYVSLVENRFAQAFRTLANLIEVDLAGQHIYASRAYGTAATTPFGTANDFTDFSNAEKILADNGAPGPFRLALGNAAIANLKGKQSGLFHVNESGTAETLREGKLGRLMGFDIYNSGQILNHTAGTAANATTDNAGYAVGATVLTLASAGTGTILAGDVITFAGDANKYVVVSGDGDVSGGGTITIAEPGLRIAMSAATKAITMVATSARNLVIGDGAIYLATRAPAMPEMGDMSQPYGPPEYVTDPVSGLVFQIVHYGGFRQMTTHVAIAWGYKTVAPRHLGILLG